MISLLLTIFTVTIIVILGVFIYLSRPNGQKNRFFSISSFYLALWIIASYLENEPNLVGFDSLEIFLRLDFVLAITYFYVWFAFSHIFANRPFSFIERYKIVPILYTTTLTLSILSLFTDTIIKGISFDKVIHFEDGPLWIFYALHMIITAFGGLVVLYFGRKNAHKRKDIKLVKQINLVFIGFFISLGNAILINLILQTFFPISIEVSRVAIYGMLALVLFTSYAIAKYRFFDVRLTLIRTFSFFSLALVLTVFYALFLQSGLLYLFDMEANMRFLFINIILTIIVALSFHPLQLWLAKTTQRVFYKNYYDSKELLAKLTHIMASNINIDTMSKSILHTLRTTLHLQGAVFIISNEQTGFQLQTSAMDKSEKEHCMDEDTAKTIQDLYVKKELCKPETKLCLTSSLHENKVKESLREKGVELIIPIKTGGTLIALLVLGEKKSGEAFTKQDLEFFSIFADEVGIALQNALSYQEIERFNLKLEKRVEERTKELKEAQKRELQKAKDVAKLKDEFVYIATHELRAPITAIRIFLEMTSEQNESIPENLRTQLQSVHEASDHLNQLIDDILEIAQSETDSLRFKVAPINVAEVIDGVLNELQSLIQHQNITVHFTQQHDYIEVNADKHKLQEVITNLISNAVKYNKENGEIHINILDDGTNVTTEIHDTGYGIPKEQQKNIFKKFFRATSKSTEEIVGTGLGMFITRMLMEKMGGKVDFSSVEGVGTTFAFSLPKPHTKEKE